MAALFNQPRSPNASTLSYDSSSVSSATSPPQTQGQTGPPAHLSGGNVTNTSTGARRPAIMGATMLPALTRMQYRPDELYAPFHPPPRPPQPFGQSFRDSHGGPSQPYGGDSHTGPSQREPYGGDSHGGPSQPHGGPGQSPGQNPIRGQMPLPPIHGPPVYPTAMPGVAAVGAQAQAAGQEPQHMHHQQTPNGGKRAYRQRRKDPSCDACRERKVKCDATETKSCSECSNRQVKCQFTKETNRRMSSMKQMQDLERQADELRRENKELRRRMADGASQLGEEGGEQTPRVVVVAAASAAAAAGRMSEPRGSAEMMDLEEMEAETGPEAELPRLPSPGANPRRWRPGGESSSAGGMALLSTAAELEAVRAKLRAFARGTWAVPAPFDSEEDRLAVPRKLTGAELPAFPSRETTDHLLQAYYISVHSLFPVLHWPTFKRDVHQLYSNHTATTTFPALFYGVMSVGSLFCTKQPQPADKGFAAHEMMETTRRLLDPWFGAAAPTLDSVRTLLLVAIFLNECHVKTAAWTWLGMAVRSAQTMGLYLDVPDSASRGGSMLVAEMRRRVWWVLYILDRTLSLELGRPGLISDADCDVALPVAVDDHYIVDDMAGPPGPGKAVVGVAVPPGAQPLTHSMLAVLNVVRTYGDLGRLLRRAGSYNCHVTRPSYVLGGTTSMATFETPFGLTPAQLATFDASFAACQRAFPATCDASLDSRETGVLSPRMMAPMAYLLHARLMLCRANLAPACGRAERRAAATACVRVARETATLVARMGEASHTADVLVPTDMLLVHYFRAALFAVAGGLGDEAAVLVRAIAVASGFRYSVAMPCGRFLAFFASAVAFKRAEYGARSGPMMPLELLLQDEELMAYASGDMQATPEGAWVWEGVAARTRAGVSLAGPIPPLGKVLVNGGGLSAEESLDWGGWDSLVARVRALGAAAALAMPAAPVHPVHMVPAVRMAESPTPERSTRTTQTPAPVLPAYEYTKQAPRKAPLANGTSRTSQDRISIANII